MIMMHQFLILVLQNRGLQIFILAMYSGNDAYFSSLRGGRETAVLQTVRTWIENHRNMHVLKDRSI